MSEEQKLACVCENLSAQPKPHYHLEMTRGIIEHFWSKVCARAEANMLKTGKLEGAHYAAATEILAEMRRAGE